MPRTVVRRPEHDTKRTLGLLALAWMDHFCVHGPGDIQGRPLKGSNVNGPAIRLSFEMERLVRDCYALDAQGKRLYDSVFFSRPKGADKSGQAARFALFEAFGPCRFAGWAEGGEVYEWMDFEYTYEPGEPMGRRITYPFLRILATEEGQTGNVYDAVYYNLHDEDAPLSQIFTRKDDVGLTRVFIPGGGEIRPSTASASSRDGGKETWCNFDETHLYTLPELRRMYDTVRRNMTKRKDASPWSFETSTMYQPGQDSIAERSHALAEMIMQEKVRVIPRFFFDHRQAPADTDLADEVSLRAGLAEAYGYDWDWQDQERKVMEVMDPRNEAPDTRRYALNQVTAATGSWIMPQWFDACVKDHTPALGALITLGLDGSNSDDHTVLTACEVETGYQWPLGMWEPAMQPEGRIQKSAVDKVVRGAFQDYDVVGFYADVHPFEDYIDLWEQELGELLCARASQLHPIKWDMRGWTSSATKMIEAYRTAIIDHVDISFSKDRRFRQYHINAREYENHHGVTVTKPKRDEKIDAVPSSGLARKARQDYLVLPEGKRRQSSQTVGVYFA